MSQPRRFIYVTESRPPGAEHGPSSPSERSEDVGRTARAQGLASLPSCARRSERRRRPPWPAYTTASDENLVIDTPITTATALKNDACDF